MSTPINADLINTGTLSDDRLPKIIKTKTIVNAVISSTSRSQIDAKNITSGTITDSRLPSKLYNKELIGCKIGAASGTQIDASNITNGVFGSELIPMTLSGKTLTGCKILASSGSQINAAAITDGTISDSRLPTRLFTKILSDSVIDQSCTISCNSLTAGTVPDARLPTILNGKMLSAANLPANSGCTIDGSLITSGIVSANQLPIFDTPTPEEKTLWSASYTQQRINASGATGATGSSGPVSISQLPVEDLQITSTGKLWTASYTNQRIAMAINEFPLRRNCKYATHISLSAAYFPSQHPTLTNNAKLELRAPLTINDMKVEVGDRILVKDQQTPIQNGIYEVTTVGDNNISWVLTRTSDFNYTNYNLTTTGGVATSYEVTPGATVYIENGYSGGQFWELATPGTVTVGISDIIWKLQRSSSSSVISCHHAYYDGSDFSNYNAVDKTLVGTGLLGNQTYPYENIPIGTRILVNNRRDRKENGIYVLTFAGSYVSQSNWVLTRDIYFTGAPGTIAYIENASGVRGGTFLALVTPRPITIGVSDIIWEQFTGQDRKIATPIVLAAKFQQFLDVTNIFYYTEFYDTTFNKGIIDNSEGTISGGILSGSITNNATLDKVATTNGIKNGSNGTNIVATYVKKVRLTMGSTGYGQVDHQLGVIPGTQIISIMPQFPPSLGPFYYMNIAIQGEPEPDRFDMNYSSSYPVGALFDILITINVII